MTIVIEKKNEEPLLDKISVEATAYSDGKTVSKEEVRKELSAQLSVSEDLIKIESIHPVFGATCAKVHASAYKQPKTREFFKRKVKKITTPAQGA